MSFTIQSLFQRGAGGAAGVMEPGTEQPNKEEPQIMSSPFGMAVPPATPFAGALFKAKEAQGGEGQPVVPSFMSGSPFSTPGTPASVGLTVGDVLAQLPPELVRSNYLPSDQVISIPQSLLDSALSNGHAAIPIFEIYRVCPVLFQAPISPQDPRMVPLPASKLPTLIANSQRGGAPAQLPPPQPGFSLFTPAEPSPFGAPQPAAENRATPPSLPDGRPKSGVSLPPRREPGMLPFATMNSVSPPAMAVPTFAPSAPLAPSPFGMAEPVPAAQGPVTMPFPQAPVAPSPFGFGAPAETKPPALPPVSPLGAAQAEATPPALPPLGSFFQKSEAPAFSFGQAQPEAAAAQPSALPAGGVTGSPFGQAEPQPFALTEPAPPAAPPPAPAMSPSRMAGPLKLSLASLLNGFSADDLGFDPKIVPTWIVTTLSASLVQEQISSGSAELELGMLIDGTTDLGFRNVLANARRNVRIPMPMNELFQGLPVPQATQAPAYTQKPAESIPPIPQSVVASFTPEPPAPPPAPAFPSANPFAAAKAAAIAQSGPLSPAAKLAMSGPIKPRDNALFDFKAPTPPADLPPAPAALPQVPAPVTQARQMVSFDPFASSAGAPAQWAGRAATPSFPPATGADGFSSDQLFGGPPAPMPPAPQAPPPPMPAFPEPEVETPSGPPASFFTSLPGIPPPLPETLQARPAPSAPLIPPAFSIPQAQPSRPAADAGQPPMAPVAPAAPAPSMPAASQAAVVSSFGITPVTARDTEQTMLRALLGVNEHLTAARVVEIMAAIPGVAACSCVSESGNISQGGSAAVAQDFQKQAGELARSVQALAPMIGISGAETFSINTDDRLMTFSFHSPIAIGVLHQDVDLAAGLRDKITLVGRELSKLVAKNGGRVS